MSRLYMHLPALINFFYKLSSGYEIKIIDAENSLSNITITNMTPISMVLLRAIKYNLIVHPYHPLLYSAFYALFGI